MTRVLIIAAWLALPGAAAGAEVIRHHMSVWLDPGQRAVRAVDRISLPPALAAARRVVVRLNAGLAIEAVDGARVEAGQAGAAPVREYALRLTGDSGEIALRYGGRLAIAHEQAGPGEWLDAGGAHLGAASAWYPVIGRGALLTFDLSVHVPEPWLALAPGDAAPAGGASARYLSRHPVEDLDLVAGPYHVFTRDEPWGSAAVWLHSPDAGLARTYLDATARHLPFYDALLGAYPGSRFTVVESPHPVGFGMPSFTLLGSRVMRLPFIAHTSLPHEIVHAWLGNGMLVEPAQGNWAEGLTAYLADHLQAERRGDGQRHRRDALARFRAATGARDLAPVSFTARHDRASQAAGYDRPMMVFHMLRRARGDEMFLGALRAAVRSGMGRRVGARELLAALAPPGEDWFSGWWLRAGAPRLALACCEVSAAAHGYRLQGSVRQVQGGAPFRLRVPLQVLVAGEAHAREYPVALHGEEAAFDIALPARPVLVAADAAFDLMRVPEAEELPPSLGELLGSGRAVAVLAPGLDAPLAQAYRSLAAAVDARVVGAKDAAAAAALWVLGRGAPEAAPYLVALDGRVPGADSRVMVVRESAGRTLAVVDGASAPAVLALARRLPHYGRYGLLGFEGDAATNTFKGEIAATASPLQVVLEHAWVGKALPLAPRAALAP